MKILIIAFSFILSSQTFANDWPCGVFKGIQNNESKVSVSGVINSLSLNKVSNLVDLNGLNGLAERDDLIACHNLQAYDTFLEIMTRNHLSDNILFASRFGIEYIPGQSNYVELITKLESENSDPYKGFRQSLCGKVNYLLIPNDDPKSFKVGLCRGKCSLANLDTFLQSQYTFLNISNMDLLPATIDSFINGSEMQGDQTPEDENSEEEVYDSLSPGCTLLSS